MDKKIIWSSGAADLVAGLLVFGGLSLDNPENYGCEERNIIMPCDSLSQYYGLQNGKCNNAEFGNKLCRSGWTKDFIIEGEKTEITAAEPQDCPIKVIAYTNTGKYFCEGIGEGKKCIRTTEILSELG